MKNQGIHLEMGDKDQKEDIRVVKARVQEVVATITIGVTCVGIAWLIWCKKVIVMYVKSLARM